MPSEFRRTQSRVWWSGLHADELLQLRLGSPVPRGPRTPCSPLPADVGSPLPPLNGGSPAAHHDQDHDEHGSPLAPEQPAEHSRNSSSSPSTSHKSQDSGFSDSEGSHRAHGSPLSSSPESASGAQAADTPSPQRPDAAPTPAGVPAPDGKRLSQDDSCIRPHTSSPSRPTAAFRRQKSAEEGRVRERVLLFSKSVIERGVPSYDVADSSLSSTTSSLSSSGPCTPPLNQTFPLMGKQAESGHRALRSFMKSKQPGRQHGQRPLLTGANQSEAPASPHKDIPGDLGALGLLGGFSPSASPDDGAEPYLDLTSGPGLPAHTSTPKATPKATPGTPATPATIFTPSCDQPTVISRVLLAATPKRRPPASTPGKRDVKRIARPVNLLRDFDRTPATSLERRALPCSGPVAAWLGQLMLSCEPECSSTLQSKALLGADTEGLRQLRRVQLATPQGLGRLQERARRLSTEYSRLCGRVQRGAASSAHTQSLVGHVRDFLRDYGGGIEHAAAARLESACERLQDPAVEATATALAALRAALTTAVDAILEKQVQELVAVLEGPASPLALRGAVSALCALGRQGPALADLVVRCGGVRALLQVVLDGRTAHTRRAALRSLSAVCCTAKAIRSLERAGGVEVVAELLAEAKRPEDERAEAAALLAQITAPWVPDNARVQGLGAHLDAVVHALTRLVLSASSSEVLLLAAAALAHVSFVEPGAVWPMLSAGAAAAVLGTVRAQGPSCSVFLQEQAATLLANMSAAPEARAELAQDRAVVALLCFLQVRPSPLQRSADTAAAERVQHKAAIALSRLASDPEVARQVVSLEGVPRLVRLCREERERNHSDGVLVACLAALRKIVANCGSMVLNEKDRRELVEPRLLDSFMLFSTRQESYV